MFRLAIIGGGCSAVLVCKQLIQFITSNRPLAVTVYDERGTFGPGTPYGESTTHDSFLLNMATSLLGTDPDDPEGFLAWLRQVPGFAGSQPDDYVSRRLMGRYLQSEYALVKRQFDAHASMIREISLEAFDVELSNGRYIVHSRGRSDEYDAIVLAAGHLKKKDHFGSSCRIFSNPYHQLDEMVNSIPRGAILGILGTKLTAVDMAIFLKGLNAGTVHMYSRSGRLPLVRGKLPTELPQLKDDDLQDVSLSGFIRWFSALRLQVGEYPRFLGSMPTQERLFLEVGASETVREWQLWLDATKSKIDRFWHALDYRQKSLFYRKYQGLWMSFRHPMPQQNAKQIADMLSSGQLVIHRGYKSTQLEASGKISVQVETGEILLDYAIDATGVAGNLARLDSDLIDNLLDRGLVRQHALGGIAIDPNTHRVEGNHNFYAIGALTQGSLFYVSAMERLALHAELIASQLSRSFAGSSLVAS